MNLFYVLLLFILVHIFCIVYIYMCISLTLIFPPNPNFMMNVKQSNQTHETHTTSTYHLSTHTHITSLHTTGMYPCTQIKTLHLWRNPIRQRNREKILARAWNRRSQNPSPQRTPTPPHPHETRKNDESYRQPCPRSKNQA